MESNNIKPVCPHNPAIDCPCPKDWQIIEEVLVECGYNVPDFEEGSKAIRELLGRGEYASHHSRRYNEAYHPHYRLIEKELFEEK